MTLVHKLSIRRSQLIRPFGVGALAVGTDGASMITAGLDHWYEREDRDDQALDPQEFKVEEPRLQGSLGVNHFRQPPDLRWRGFRNTRLHVPMLRFPQWHQCPRCRALTHWPLTDTEMHDCASCEQQHGRKYRLIQVRFVAMCSAGHLGDFPWREWVHETQSPMCDEAMRMSGMSARCSCGKSRSLRNVTYRSLAVPGGNLVCSGAMPWLGGAAREECDEDVRAAFRTSSNVYFPITRSSIFIPPDDSCDVPAALIKMLEGQRLLLDLLKTKNLHTPSHLREVHEEPLKDYSDEQIEAALAAIDDRGERSASAPAPPGEHTDTTFRRPEFEVLRRPLRHDELRVRVREASEYDEPLGGKAASVALVERLRVTEALTGFARVQPDDGRDDRDRMRLLRRKHARPGSPEDWLPAHVVHGEGILVDLESAHLRTWENNPDVRVRVDVLKRHYRAALDARAAGVRPERFALTPRFVLLHTLAHLVINRLTYESGYSSAAIAERLYVSEDPAAPMAALLIYTAAGDSDGTLGGLVRLGQPGHLERIVEEALQGAAWCSADPVCAGLSSQHGQGPDSCNLAACHSCALTPEPSCEISNRFLDRALVVRGVGDEASAGLGFFEDPGSLLTS